MEAIVKHGRNYGILNYRVGVKRIFPQNNQRLKLLDLYTPMTYNPNDNNIECIA
jgi:hypothetical protein